MPATRTALLPDRAVLRASGGDVRALLQRVVTGNVEAVTPGRAVYSLLLTPQGKFLFDFFMVADPAREDALLLDCARARAGDLMARLSLYKLRADAHFEDVSADYRVGAAWDPDAAVDKVPAGGTAHADPRWPQLGLRMILPAGAEEGPAGAEEGLVDGRAAAAEAYRAFTLSQGVPDGARDLRAGKDFPAECNLDLLNAIDFTKGCFIGQEVASRMHRRGKLRKRLVTGRIVEGPLPPPESAVTIHDGRVGEVLGGIAPSENSGGGIVLAQVFLDRVARARSEAGAGAGAGAGATPVRAGDSLLALEVPPYADFSLQGEDAPAANETP